MKNHKQCLLVFAKPPTPGYAKTRLIPALGQQGAAELHRRLVLRTLAKVSSKGLWDVQLWCAGDINDDFFQSCLSQFDISLKTQSGSDLGKRMSNAFEDALANYDRVVVIGTDCPLLDQKIIAESFHCLTNYPVVINPAEDGGYVLLGLKSVDDKVFENVSWGTSLVTQQTLSNLNKLNWTTATLPLLWDVDLPQDLEKLAELDDFTL